MLKRLGLAGLLFATLAVTPLTVAAQDRNEGFHNIREPQKTQYVKATRFETRGRENRFRNVKDVRQQQDHCR